MKNNLNNKTICNVGYIGYGDYFPMKNDRIYEYWRGMVRRCYDIKMQKNVKSSSYINCIVCEEWLNFQNFAKWFEDNYYEINGERMELDKDILHKGNKIYSPYYCVFVPNNINALFIKGSKARGEYPIGVSFKYNKLRARLRKMVNGKSKEIHIGCFTNIEEAFNAYKIEKEKHIKVIADEYKNKIPEILYEAMYRYEISITD